MKSGMREQHGRVGKWVEQTDPIEWNIRNALQGFKRRENRCWTIYGTVKMMKIVCKELASQSTRISRTWLYSAYQSPIRL